MTIQPQNNNLNYLIDPTFTNVNRLFLLPFTRDNAGDRRDSFSHYYVPNVEIKDFNVSIDRKNFSDLPVKNEEEVYEKIIDMSNNNDYTTGNLLDFVCLKMQNKLILMENLKTKVMEKQCFSLLKNQKKLLLIFHKILSQSYK